VRPLGTRERATLHRTARKTWRYFETFVTDADAWLPPDNYQEDAPAPKLARRTSPTNIGMGLLSTLAAHDLGYLSTAVLARRLDATLRTLEGLERYQGHFLNWYDTATLAPLHPRYVSTVDSGNLAGALIAVAEGALELERHPQTIAQRLSGLADTADLLAEATATVHGGTLDRHTLSDVNRLARAVAETARSEQPEHEILGMLDTLGLQLAATGASIDDSAHSASGDDVVYCRLAIVWPTPRDRDGSTPRSTTCWRRKLASRASSPSPRVMFRSTTGSTSDASSPTWTAARR
jgi:hypothetical protein